MLGFYNYTVILTYMSLVSSVVGIAFAVSGNVFNAIVCLMLSGFLDMFDGKVAKTRKRTEEEKKFGIQIDSLSDLVAFGVLPAFIGYALGLKSWWGIAIVSLFVLAALIRLAYFNVLEEDRQKKTTENRKEYLGLPVTSDALIIPVIYALKKYIKYKFYLIYAIVLTVIAFLFLFKFKVKKPTIKGMIVMTVVGAIELLLLVWLMKL